MPLLKTGERVPVLSVRLERFALLLNVVKLRMLPGVVPAILVAWA